MKSILVKHILFLLLVLGFSIDINAQTFVLDADQQNSGLKIIKSDKHQIKLSHQVNTFHLKDVDIQGVSMKQLDYGSSFIPGKEGAPDLKGISRYVLIPDGAKVKLKVSHKEVLSYQNMEIAPAAPIPFDTEDQKPAIKGKQYQKDAFFPMEIAESKVSEVRGLNLALVHINPFQYNPVTKELLVYKNLEVEIEILGGYGSYGEERFRNRYWDQIFDDLIFNHQDLPEMSSKDHPKDSNDNEGCEYLIIVPNNAEFLPWADSIKLFRTEQGIHTKIVTMDEVGGNTVDQVKNFMNTVYETWNPVPAAVLLMADYGNDENTITSKSYPHPYSGNYITDNYYADYTGNDLPDFVFARMTGRNDSEMEIMVEKFIEYERNPPIDPNFYQHPITALGWQTERWFQICSETVGGYMANVLGKTPIRINAVYDGNPSNDPWSTATNTNTVIDYFGPNGQGYIPATPAELGGWSGGTASDIVTAINNGAFILQHRDHGGNSGWGEPAFNTSHINQLNNVGKLSHIFSINCLTGQFDLSNECFTEKFHRHANGGALSLTAASQVSYSFVNDAFVWGLYDNMWPDFMPDYGGNAIAERDFRPAFGSASGKYFLSTNSWAYNSGSKQITYRLFHHHGDAFNIVYTEVPQALQVVNTDLMMYGVEMVDIQANEGALIAFSVDGELIATGIGTGASQQINIGLQTVGTIIKVVVSKQNYFRYESTISILPADGPYVIHTGFQVNDAAGNNNSEVDIEENIWLDMTLKNIGSDAASNITATLSSLDEYVSIIEGQYTIGSLLQDQELNFADVFNFNVADDVPDQHQVDFDFTASDGEEDWNSNISIIINAPDPDFGTFIIDDADNGNGNGVLEPGESADISVEILNNGHFEMEAGSLVMSSLSSYLIINTSSITVDPIAQGASSSVSFNVTADADAVFGSLWLIDLEYSAGKYAKDMVWEQNLGKVKEDFESGDFSQFDWQLGSNPWGIVGETEAYEGDFGSRSGGIGHSEVSLHTLNYTLINDGEFSFYYKVSSESSYDYLKFYINGVLQDSWSGMIDWNKASYNLQAGSYTFTWEYTKDSSVSSGSDCAWIDLISFPFDIVNDAVLFQAPLEQDLSPGEVFTTKVKIANVSNLAAFNINIDFDPSLLQVNAVLMGDFLGSTGRTIIPISQQIDNTNGNIHYEINSTGGDQSGPDGSGMLLYLEWQVNTGLTESSETQLFFNNPILLDGTTTNIPVEIIHANVQINNCYDGDVDCDCDIDIVDISTIAYTYGSITGDPLYNAAFDLDNDGDIDIIDITMVAYNYGWSCGDKLNHSIIETDNTNVMISESNSYNELEDFGYLKILVSQVEQLGAYELACSYSPTDIEILELIGGSIIHKTERETIELLAEYSDEHAWVKYAITSLGSTEDGAHGAGELLTIKYKRKTAHGDINLEHGQLARIDGEEIPFVMDQLLSHQEIMISELMTYPIPMTDRLNIEYQIEMAGSICFELQDLNGKVIRQWTESHQYAGSFTSSLEKGNLSSGTYILTLKNEKQIWNKRKIIVQ